MSLKLRRHHTLLWQIIIFSKCRDGLFDFVIVFQPHAGKHFDWLYDYNALELNALLLNGSWNTIGNKRIFTTMGLKPAVINTCFKKEAVLIHSVTNDLGQMKSYGIIL